jgi:hypothetical protein
LGRSRHVQGDGGQGRSSRLDLLNDLVRIVPSLVNVLVGQFLGFLDELRLDVTQPLLKLTLECVVESIRVSLGR